MADRFVCSRCGRTIPYVKYHDKRIGKLSELPEGVACEIVCFPCLNKEKQERRKALARLTALSQEYGLDERRD